MIITTPFTERFATTPSSTVGTDGSSAISALRHGTIAAWRPYVTITVSVFDLAVGSHAALSCANSANNMRMRLPAHSNS